MAPRSIAKYFLALLLNFAVCAPYAHAALEFGHQEECSMELCKRTGKCCCRQSNAGKPHLETSNHCRSTGAQLPGGSSPVAAILAHTHVLAGLVPTTELFIAIEVVTPAARVSILRFQRPPPQSV